MALKVLFMTSIVIILVAFLLHKAVHVPAEIEQSEDLYWVFAHSKAVRALATVGEYIGLTTNRVKLVRDLLNVFPPTFAEPFNTTGVKVEKTLFDGVEVLVHEPDNKAKNGPALIWIHGGGWVIGSAEYDQVFTEEFSRRLQIIVISINYRLAPEHLFPTSIDDCFAASKYFLEHASEYDVDPNRVAVAGLSAGGNLAAAVSLKFRDSELSLRPKLQALLAPCLQPFDFKTPSYQIHSDNAFLPASFMVDFWLWYALGPDGHVQRNNFLENKHTSPEAKISKFAKFVSPDLLDPKYVGTSYKETDVTSGSDEIWKEVKDIFLNPYFSPLMAQDLTRLPEAFIASAEWDILRDDGLMYGKRLVESDVPVELKYYDKGFHHLLIHINHFRLSQVVVNDLVDFLSRKL